MLSSLSIFLLLAHATHLLASPVSSQPLARTLAVDDVIVLSEGGSATVMKDYEYAELQRRAKMANEAVARRAASSAKSRKGTRGCEESVEVQVLTDDTFLNWDVAMSPVVSALGGTSSVSVTEGYSIAESVAVGATVGASLESILSESFSLTYTETWTTTSTTSLSFTVPENQYGLIVSQPSVRRQTGYYLSGCTDSWDKEAFTADTYRNQSYGNMEWPTGVIRLCNSTQYPIPFCIGSGSHS